MLLKSQTLILLAFMKVLFKLNQKRMIDRVKVDLVFTLLLSFFSIDLVFDTFALTIGD